MLIATYVDDLLVASPSIQDIIQFEKDLQKKLNIKILGDVQHILGWRIKYDEEHGDSIDQHSYITKILEQYGMKDCNPAKTPALKTSKSRLNQTNKTETSLTAKQWAAFSTWPTAAVQT